MWPSAGRTTLWRLAKGAGKSPFHHFFTTFRKGRLNARQGTFSAMFPIVTTARTLDSVQQKKLALEQLRLALKNLRPNCWLMPLLAAVTCVMFARWISVPMLVFWFSLVAVGGAYLGIVVYGFLAKEPNELPSRNWPAQAAVGYGLFAVSWGSLA